ncbi:hypothetical protein DV736_g4160, partial [Chaetothyriales sp. CBS 134916]
MFARAAFRTCSSPLLTRTRPVLVAFGLSIPFLQPRPVTRFDVSPIDEVSSEYLYSKAAKTPLTQDGTLNPAAVKQISFGSLLGLGAGLLYMERKGYHLIPVDKLQRYVKGIDVRSAIYDNVAFKISFGLMFALTAFGEF